VLVLAVVPPNAALAISLQVSCDTTTGGLTGEAAAGIETAGAGAAADEREARIAVLSASALAALAAKRALMSSPLVATTCVGAEATNLPAPALGRAEPLVGSSLCSKAMGATTAAGGGGGGAAMLVGPLNGKRPGGGRPAAARDGIGTTLGAVIVGKAKAAAGPGGNTGAAAGGGWCEGRNGVPV
jgi:hypothetical protein